MRQISLISIVAMIGMASCDTASNVEPVFQNYFVKYYGHDGNQEGVDLLINADGSMIMLGNSSSQTNPTTIPFIVKIDPLGNLLWQRQLGDLGEAAVDVELDNQGNLIVVSNIGDEPNSRIRIFKLNQQGAGIDSLIIPSNEKQVAKSVTTTTDNRFVITGYAAPDINRNPGLPSPSLDKADVIVLEVDQQLKNHKIFSTQGGGEYEGAGVKVFERIFNGNLKYLIFGYSDRPVDGSIIYKKSFEVIRISQSGNPDGTRLASGLASEEQIASFTTEVPAALGEGFLTVGYTQNSSGSSEIYFTQYNETATNTRLNNKIEIPNTRLAGISAACAEPDAFYILANEITDNNKRDIFLLKLASDGAVIGSTSFGALGGDDTGGAVRVLPDKRVALLGTMELETQKKMVLIIISPDGKFSN